MKKKYLFALAAALLLTIANQTVKAQYDAMIGEIRMFAGNFAPRGWALCNGQLLSIAQNTALFSILGTTYGGDGRATFALPDLRSRVPLHTGQGQGLSPRQLGEQGGTENIFLTIANLPAHGHNVMLTGIEKEGNTHLPTGAYPANTKLLDKEYYKPTLGEAPTLTTMYNLNTATTGQNQPVNNMQPYLGINYIICLQGIYPTRD